MPNPHPPYPPEFRRQMVELVRSGRTPQELSRESKPSAGAIRNWVRQAELDEGRRSDALTSDEKEELRRLKRENRQLRMEREILRSRRLTNATRRCPARESGSIPDKRPSYLLSPPARSGTAP